MRNALKFLLLFILHLVNLESEALPMLGSEPPFSEDSLLSHEFKSNDVANQFSTGKTNRARFLYDI